MDIRKIDTNMQENKEILAPLVKYYDLNNHYLRGLAFSNGFNRLRESDFVSDNVLALQRHTSGVNITFSTNSKSIRIKAKLDSASYMVHMTAIGQVGFDLYIKNNERFIFLSTTKINKPNYEVTFVEGLDGNVYTYRVYFPLYMGVKEAFIGIDEDAFITFSKPVQEKVVIYGTSISQGGCATRPGMSYSNILDRKTNYELINLGFSGSAHLEPKMADILNEVEMKYLILEVEANNTSAGLASKLEIFINRLKVENIILISHFPISMSLIKEEVKAEINKNFEFQKSIKNVTFIDGKKLLEELDYDETVDGVHLTDLGFWMVANKLKEYLK